MANYNAVSYNVIYVYSIDDAEHEGFLKIGKTSFYSKNSIAQLPANCDEIKRAAYECIYEQTHRSFIKYNLLHAELAAKPIVMNDGSIQYQAFDDFLVRAIIKKSVDKYVVKYFEDTGRSSEWVQCDLDFVITAIDSAKKGLDRIPETSNQEKVSSQKTVKINLRKEQLENVEKTISILKTYDSMLWDCKMRYGKTVTAYEVIRRMNEKGRFKKVIVITHRPAVEDGWGEDHDLMFAGTNHRFIDKTNGREEYNGALDAENDRQLQNTIESGVPFVYFASIQDLRGSASVGGKYNKNNLVFDIDWDLLIVDEAHEGTRTELGDAVITTIKKPNTKVLSLSGTPYNLLGEYQDENRYTWSYIDEQRAKKEWEEEHPNEKNPYEELPTMNIYTFDITEQIPDSYRYVTEDSAFNFREFFRTWTGNKDKDYRDIPEGKRIGDFVNEDAVYCFLSLISKEDPNSNYPFSTEEFRDMFRHTFWLVPGVAAAKALSAMLKKHPRFKDEYEIVNIAGEGDAERPYDEALGLVKSAIKTYPKTISISCGKLTTGVTVREWTGVMMLSGSASTAASGYMQTIFRVQSPGFINGKQKTNCYVFDFAPDRTLKVIAEVHHLRHKRGQGDDEKAKQVLGEFLNFCPVISIEGTVMRSYDVPEMMRQIKKISVEAAINSGFDDDTIYKSDAGIIMDKYDTEILRKLSDVVVPKGKSKKKSEVDVNVHNMTNEERKTAERALRKKKKDLTPEEKEALEKLRKQKEEQKKMFNLLRAVSIRLPLLFYGADADISQIIHLKDFVKLVDDESWEEFMPKGLKKELFIDILKYYDEDVVTGAGLRIRRMAKAADELPPTKRAKRVIEILSRFKNPDQETVLTPWRVVNLQLGETVGGYCFFDETYTEEIEEPRLIEQGNITANILLNESTKILEMNSKTGLYPLYMAYSVYMMYVDGNEQNLPLEKAQKIWFRTLKNNIYVLCKTKMARTITIRTLAGYSNETVNAVYLTKLVEERLKDIPRLSRKLRSCATWGQEGVDRMKFDAVVGNPPFQLITAKQVSDVNGQPTRTNIFHLFQQAADMVSERYVSLIYPGGRWMHRSGKGEGMAAFGLKQINEQSLTKLIFFPNAKELFSNVDISDGISIVFKDKEKNSSGFIYEYRKGLDISSIHVEYPGEELMPLDPRDNVIVEKISMGMRENNFEAISKRILPRSLFGIESVFAENNMEAIESYDGKEYDWNKKAKLLTNDKSGSAGRATWFIVDREVIPKGQKYINEWQVIVSSAHPAGQEGRDNCIEIADNHSAFGRSRVALGSFKTEEEAKNFYKYCQTDLIRYTFLMTDEALTSLGKRVPDILDYTNENKWIKFDEDIDVQLYALFGLNDEEIDYVRTYVKTKSEPSEYTKMLSMNYPDIVESLLNKYGNAKLNYYKDTGCTIKNKGVARTNEGLYCHHIDEDKAIMLSNDLYAAKNPFEYQKANRLVYCNVLEHLILHTKIAEEPRNKDANDDELQGIGGAVAFLCKELNDIYSGKEYAEEWRQKIAEQVKDSFDDYIAVLKHLWNVVKGNPIYRRIITKESLCVGTDGKVVQEVLAALD